MAISGRDVKVLWGRAGGRCSYPGCNTDCLPFLDKSEPTVVGEMAHVIARSPDGPRGNPTGGSDDYDNLILLCPTHHTFVDKAAEGTFTEEDLRQWKREHEAAVNEALSVATFNGRVALLSYIGKLLTENHACWETYGPEGMPAKKDPNSSLASIWDFRKLAIIIPNNKRISECIDKNWNFFTANEYKICREFVEHAAGYERGAYEAVEGLPRFPSAFSELICGQR